MKKKAWKFDRPKWCHTHQGRVISFQRKQVMSYGIWMTIISNWKLEYSDVPNLSINGELVVKKATQALLRHARALYSVSSSSLFEPPTQGSLDGRCEMLYQPNEQYYWKSSPQGMLSRSHQFKKFLSKGEPWPEFAARRTWTMVGAGPSKCRSLWFVQRSITSNCWAYFPSTRSLRVLSLVWTGNQFKWKRTSIFMAESISCWHFFCGCNNYINYVWAAECSMHTHCIWCFLRLYSNHPKNIWDVCACVFVLVVPNVQHQPVQFLPSRDVLHVHSLRAMTTSEAINM